MTQVNKKMLGIYAFVFFLLPFSLLNAANVGFVQGIWFNPDPFFANEAVRINTAIQNSEGMPAAGTLEVYLDDELLASKNFTVLDDNVALPSVIVTFPYGNHTIVAKISELNIVDGTTQTNIDVTEALVSLVLLVDNDTDGDGIGDLEDTDDDGDGFSDVEEVTSGTNPLASSSNPVQNQQNSSNNSGGSNSNSSNNNNSSNDSDDSTEQIEEEVVTDTDGDGFSDVEEVAAGTDPNDSDDHPTSVDTDGDGFSDNEEIIAGTDPNNANDHPTVNATDSDGDGFSDVEEVAAGTDPNDSDDHPVTTNTDTDGDGFSDEDEIASGTDPNNANDHPTANTTDSDGDGFSDTEEILSGTNPDDAGDHPTSVDSDGDGFSDREEALASTSSSNSNDHPEALGDENTIGDQTAAILSAALAAEETLRESLYQQLLAAEEALAQSLTQNAVVNQYAEEGVYSVSESGNIIVTDENGISYKIDTEGNLIPITNEGLPLNSDFSGNLIQVDKDGYVYYINNAGERIYVGTNGAEYAVESVNELTQLYPEAELLWIDQKGNVWAQDAFGDTVGTEPLENPFGLNNTLLDKLLNIFSLGDDSGWFAHPGGSVLFNPEVSILSKTAYAVISTLRFFFSSIWLLVIFIALWILIVRKLYLLFGKYRER